MDPVELRNYRLQQEREYYLTVEGFLDFARDSGAAPDAVQKPHGEGAHEILNWTWIPDPEDPKRGQYKWKLQLWPRGTFKSSVFNVALVAWEIARNPDIRICVCSETSKQAIPFVRKTMEIIDSQWFRDRFGVHKGKNWKTGSFISEQRKRTNVKEATLQASGAGEVRVGSHWDLVIMDDVVSDKNTATPETQEKLQDWFSEITAQLDPGARLLMIGTLHHYADLYCKILKDDERRQDFETSINSWENPDGTLFAPSILTRQEIEFRKRQTTSRKFACYYENKPNVDEKQIFRPEYFRTIQDYEIPLNCWTYILTDFAFISEEKKTGKADRTCFWVVSLDANRCAYVRDVHVGRWKPSDSVRLACSLWNRASQSGWNPRGLVIEKTTHAELLTSLFEEVRRETFIRPKIITIGGRSQEIKDLRIEGAEVRFKQGNIFFAASLAQDNARWKPMFEEMTEWPYSDHDDVPDAISDLDKQDNDEKYYLPAPPAGWRAQIAQPYHPSVINGQFNPNRPYPADQMHRSDHQQTNDLWRSNLGKRDSAQHRDQNSLFRQPQRPQGPYRTS